MTLSVYDYEIAIAAWVISLFGAGASQFFALHIPDVDVVGLIGATTVNLWHQRQTYYKAGEAFARRVRDVVDKDWHELKAKVELNAANIKVVKDTQQGINIALRGNPRPGPMTGPMVG